MEAVDTLLSTLRADPLVTAHLSAAQIDTLLESANDTGSAGFMVDAVLAKVERS